MGQIGLYYGFRLAPNLLIAGAAFTLMNVALRVVNSYRLGENLNLYNWTGVVLLIVAMFLLKVK
jgi:multidrug transporter EmrE-like cation transporter